MQVLDANAGSSRRYIHQVWNERNFAVIDELIAEDFVAHDPFAGDQHGAESQHQFVQGMVSAFPDVVVEIEDQEVDGNTVTTYVVFTGTQTGELVGPQGALPPSNAVAIVPVKVRDRYENGRIVESWAEWDPQEMLSQLGYA